MKTKKFNANWQGVLLGMVLCLVLVVFLGSKPANPQDNGTLQQQRVLQRAANVTDVWDKTVALEDRLVRMEQKIDRLREQMDYLLKNMEKMWRGNK